MRSKFAVTVAHHSLIKLVGQLESRELQIHLHRFFKCDSEVFDIALPDTTLTTHRTKTTKTDPDGEKANQKLEDSFPETARLQSQQKADDEGCQGG